MNATESSCSPAIRLANRCPLRSDQVFDCLPGYCTSNGTCAPGRIEDISKNLLCGAEFSFPFVT